MKERGRTVTSKKKFKRSYSLWVGKAELEPKKVRRTHDLQPTFPFANIARRLKATTHDGRVKKWKKVPMAKRKWSFDYSISGIYNVCLLLKGTSYFLRDLVSHVDLCRDSEDLIPLEQMAQTRRCHGTRGGLQGPESCGVLW